MDPKDINRILSYRLKAMQSVLGAIKTSAKNRKRQTTVLPSYKIVVHLPQQTYTSCHLYAAPSTTCRTAVLKKKEKKKTSGSQGLKCQPLDQSDTNPFRTTGNFLKLQIPRPHSQRISVSTRPSVWS